MICRIIIFIHQAFIIIYAKFSADNIRETEFSGEVNLMQKYGSYLIQSMATNMEKDRFDT